MADVAALIEAAKQNEAEYLDKYKSDKWKKVGDYDHNVVIHRMDYAGRGVSVFKGETQFNTSVENMDRLFGDLKPILGGLISSRDFTDVRVDNLIKNDDEYYAYSCQTTVKLGKEYTVPPSNGAVRGQSYSSGMYMKGIRTKDGKGWETDKCAGTIILQTDPKGWIMQSAVNQAMTGEITRLFSKAKNVVATNIDIVQKYAENAEEAK